MTRPPSPSRITPSPLPVPPLRERKLRHLADGLREAGWSVTAGNVSRRDFLAVAEASAILYEADDPAVCHVWHDGKVLGQGRRDVAIRRLCWLLERHAHPDGDGETELQSDAARPVDVVKDLVDAED